MTIKITERKPANYAKLILIFYPTGLEEWRRAVGGPAPATPHTPGTTGD